MAWLACAPALAAAVILGRRAGWGWPDTVLSAIATGAAALWARWAIVTTLTPAYPQLEATLRGPWVALAIAGVVVHALAHDHLPGSDPAPR